MNFAGGVLDVNPITAFLPLDLEGHGVDPCSGWYTAGQGSMLAVDLWAGVGTQAARMRDSALLGRESALVGRGGSARGGLLNHTWLRIGWEWNGPAVGGQDVFRIGIGHRRWHIEIWEVGRALFR